MPRRVVAVLCAVLLVAACSGPPTTKTELPVPGGTLTVSVRDLATLDPAKVAGPGAQSAIAHIFDSLTAIDPITKEVIPAAASSWRVLSDGVTWRFTIANSTYSNGARVRAVDFKFAFDRLVRKATNSDAAFQLEHVRGFHEAKETGTARGLSGVTAPLQDLLVITLLRPFMELPYALADPHLAPLPAARYTKSPAGVNVGAVGNGPFRAESVKLGTRARLVRNERYSGRSAYVEAMELKVVSSVEAGWRDFLAGATDVAEVPVSAVGSGRRSFGSGGFTPAWATLSFGLNLKHEKYTKPEVRRAISLAIDRRAIAESVYGGTKAPATGILPLGVRGYRETACSVCDRDLSRARSIVEQEFGSKPPTIVVDHLGEQSSRIVARAVADDLSEAGFKTKLRPHSRGSYLSFLTNGKHDFAQLGWLSDVSSPDGFLAQQLRSDSTNNETGFRDSLFDYRIDRARIERREDRRLTLYQQAEKRAMDLMPLIPIVFFRNRTAVAERVRGFRLDGAGIFDGATLWVS